MDSKYPGRMILAEADQWPEDAIAYFGKGDECQMAFHFPLMPRLFMAMRMEDRFRLPRSCSSLRDSGELPVGAFLRNHDELTLEMVTDEERDYMYRVYAQDRKMRVNLGIRRRLAPLLGNDRRRIELMNSPALFAARNAGDLLWRRNRHGRGPTWATATACARPCSGAPTVTRFSRANPQKLYAGNHRSGISFRCHQRGGPAEQSALVAVVDEAAHPAAPALPRAQPRHLELLQPDNRRVLAFVREYEGERILVVANLSRFVQGTEIPLAKFQGLTPTEMFGRTEFPPITDSPYFVSLGPHSFYGSC